MNDQKLQEMIKEKQELEHRIYDEKIRVSNEKDRIRGEKHKKEQAKKLKEFIQKFQDSVKKKVNDAKKEQKATETDIICPICLKRQLIVLPDPYDKTTIHDDRPSIVINMLQNKDRIFCPVCNHTIGKAFDFRKK